MRSRAVLWCDLLIGGPGRWPGGGGARACDSVERRISDVPVVGHPLELRVRVSHSRCVHDGCARGLRPRQQPAGPPSVVDHPWLGAVRAVARELRRSWGTMNSIAVAATG